jgi:hypothetical protein
VSRRARHYLMIPSSSLDFLPGNILCIIPKSSQLKI